MGGGSTSRLSKRAAGSPARRSAIKSDEDLEIEDQVTILQNPKSSATARTAAAACLCHHARPRAGSLLSVGLMTDSIPALVSLLRDTSGVAGQKIAVSVRTPFVATSASAPHLMPHRQATALARICGLEVNQTAMANAGGIDVLVMQVRARRREQY